jgi:hypothetical protein
MLLPAGQVIRPGFVDHLRSLDRLVARECPLASK